MYSEKKNVHLHLTGMEINDFHYLIQTIDGQKENQYFGLDVKLLAINAVTYTRLNIIAQATRVRPTYGG